MTHGRVSNRREGNRCVEGNESSLVLDGKGEEIDVRKLARSVYSCRVDDVRIQ